MVSHARRGPISLMTLAIAMTPRLPDEPSHGQLSGSRTRVSNARAFRYSAVGMCKYILLALLLLFVLLMAAAALVVQEYGWTGFLALLAGLVVLGFVLRLALPWLFGHVVAWPLRRMGRPLRGAHVVVHSVTPCDPP